MIWFRPASEAVLGLRVAVSFEGGSHGAHRPRERTGVSVRSTGALNCTACGCDSCAPATAGNTNASDDHLLLRPKEVVIHPWSRSSDSRIVLHPSPSRRPAVVPPRASGCIEGFRPRLQRRARAGISPASLFRRETSAPNPLGQTFPLQRFRESRFRGTPQALMNPQGGAEKAQCKGIIAVARGRWRRCQ